MSWWINHFRFDIAFYLWVTVSFVACFSPDTTVVMSSWISLIEWESFAFRQLIASIRASLLSGDLFGCTLVNLHIIVMSSIVWILIWTSAFSLLHFVAAVWSNSFTSWWSWFLIWIGFDRLNYYGCVWRAWLTETFLYFTLSELIWGLSDCSLSINLNLGCLSFDLS